MNALEEQKITCSVITYLTFAKVIFHCRDAINDIASLSSRPPMRPLRGKDRLLINFNVGMLKKLD